MRVKYVNSLTGRRLPCRRRLRLAGWPALSGNRARSAARGRPARSRRTSQAGPNPAAAGETQRRTVPDKTTDQAGPRQPSAKTRTLGLSDVEVALLGLLSIRPMTGYEIRRSYARGLAPWWETPRTQIYPKLRELKRRGLVRDELVVQHGKPNKRVYTIEPAGSEALVSWLRRVISWPVMKHQMMMRLFFGNLLPLPEFRQLLTDYSERMATMVDSLRTAHTRFSAALTGPYRTSVFFELLSLEHLIKMAELEVSGTRAILAMLARADRAFTMDNGDQASQLLEAIREQAQALLPARRALRRTPRNGGSTRPCTAGAVPPPTPRCACLATAASRSGPGWTCSPATTWKPRRTGWGAALDDIHPLRAVG